MIAKVLNEWNLISFLEEIMLIIKQNTEQVKMPSAATWRPEVPEPRGLYIQNLKMRKYSTFI